jgi:hypothetical protein
MRESRDEAARGVLEVGRNNDQKMKRVEFSDATTVERMASLEERVFTLERKVAGSKE